MRNDKPNIRKTFHFCSNRGKRKSLALRRIIFYLYPPPHAEIRMHVLRTVCCLICCSLTGLAQGPVRFDDFFEEAALRVDFYQTVDANNEVITLDRLHR